MKVPLLGAAVAGASLWATAEAVALGPNGCVSVGRSGAGTCQLSTNCKGVDLSKFEFAFTCQNYDRVHGTSVIRHSYGFGGFAEQEEFDTEVKCGRCGAPTPLPHKDTLKASGTQTLLTGTKDAAKAKAGQYPMMGYGQQPNPNMMTPMQQYPMNPNAVNPIAGQGFNTMAAAPAAPTLQPMRKVLGAPGPVAAPAGTPPLRDVIPAGPPATAEQMVAQSPSSAPSAAIAANGDENYGPGGCVSTRRSKAGTCVIETNCGSQEAALSKMDVGVICVDQAGAPVRHNFGAGAFATVESFDTLIACHKCLGTDDIPEEVAMNGRVLALSSQVKQLDTVLTEIASDVKLLNEVVSKKSEVEVSPVPSAPAAAPAVGEDKAAAAPAVAPAAAPVAAFLSTKTKMSQMSDSGSGIVSMIISGLHSWGSSLPAHPALAPNSNSNSKRQPVVSEVYTALKDIKEGQKARQAKADAEEDAKIRAEATSLALEGDLHVKKSQEEAAATEATLREAEREAEEVAASAAEEDAAESAVRAAASAESPAAKEKKEDKPSAPPAKKEEVSSVPAKVTAAKKSSAAKETSSTSDEEEAAMAAISAASAAQEKAAKEAKATAKVKAALESKQEKESKQAATKQEKKAETKRKAATEKVAPTPTKKPVDPDMEGVDDKILDDATKEAEAAVLEAEANREAVLSQTSATVSRAAKAEAVKAETVKKVEQIAEQKEEKKEEKKEQKKEHKKEEKSKAASAEEELDDMLN
eukprot:TRINITY_DN5507_c0_g1_i1.p1 TRINITY_DN5507_c0_g1~~TRINITY_DN5507_c0_g1_i1.p1  ORF type:complete len:751 (-),score=269.19 TRINITY_DN5507_c0_g1_i1:146-2398(-)